VSSWFSAVLPPSLWKSQNLDDDKIDLVRSTISYEHNLDDDKITSGAAFAGKADKGGAQREAEPRQRRPGRGLTGSRAMSYEAFKVIHLFGVIVFLGNIIVTGLWKVMADRTGQPQIIAYSQRLVTLTDWIFTAGGVALILIGAYGMAAVGHLDWRGATWLMWGQAIFAASGLIWIAILIPTQIVQARQARGFAGGGAIPESYWRHGRRWMIWGTIATVIPLANLYFMVFKP
jgi:uncharacterized membrane protein